MSKDYAFEMGGSLPMDGEILCMTRTKEFVYVATKSQKITQIPILNFNIKNNKENDGNKQMNSDSDLRNMTALKYEANGREGYKLFVQFKKDIALLEESRFPERFTPIGFKNPMLMGSTQDKSKLILVDTSYNVAIFSLSRDGTKIEREGVIKSGMKPQGLVIAQNHFVLYDSKYYKIFDLQLNGSEAFSAKEFKSIVAIEGTDYFAAIPFNGNHPRTINSKNMIEPLQCTLPSENILSISFKHPYCYIVTSNSMIISSTFSDKISETFTNLRARKNPLVLILDSYICIVATQNYLYYYKYSTPTKHLNALAKDKTWEQAFAMCQAFNNLQNFNATEELNKLYGKYSNAKFNSQIYEVAFEYFRKSKQHPFEILKNFKQCLNDQFKDAVDMDSKQHEEALINVLDALHTDHNPDNTQSIDVYRVDPNEVSVALQKLYAQTQIHKEPKSLDWLMDHYNDIAKEIRAELRAAKAFETQKSALFSTQKTPSLRDESKPVIIKYLDELVSNEKQSTTLKIYNSILIQFVGSYAPTALIELLNKRPPLFFDVAYDALKKMENIEAIISLCSTHSQHDSAISFLLKSGSVEQAIDYIQNLDNEQEGKTFEVGCRFFEQIWNTLYEQAVPKKGADVQKEIYERTMKQKKAANIFCSPKLTAMQVDAVLKFLREKKPSSFTPEIRNVIITKFLEYAIYGCHMEAEWVHMELIKTYVELLTGNETSRLTRERSTDKFDEKSTKRYGGRALMIAEEKNPLVIAYRTGLLKILQTSNSYNTAEAIILLNNNYPDEMFAALKKGRNYSEAAPLMKQKDIQHSIMALDMMWEPGNREATKLYDEFFLDELKAGNHQNVITLLNECSARISPGHVSDNIPNSYHVSELKTYFAKTTTDKANHLRMLKLKNAFLEAIIKQKEQQLSYLKGGYAEVRETLCCTVCAKPVEGTVFCVLKDNGVVHVGCKHKLQTSSDLV